MRVSSIHAWDSLLAWKSNYKILSIQGDIQLEELRLKCLQFSQVIY